MVPLTQLWLPIVLSAVIVFVASSLIHMVLKWHNSDYRALPNEEEVRAAIRKGSPAPGQYVLPHCGDMKEMGKPWGSVLKDLLDGLIYGLLSAGVFGWLWPKP